MIYEAYIGGFLRTIIIIGLAFYSLRFIARLLTKKSNSSASNSKNKKRNGKNDDLGEYVDFEEVKD